ncbi:MAG: hypothetical protein AAF224_01025 [Pseudomonadota bacterium]
MGAAMMIMAGCATQDTLALKEDPAYTRGFSDGCVTAEEEDKSFSTKRVRDAYEFDNSRAYRAGWRQGHIECQNPMQEIETGGRILGNEPGF